MLPTTVICTKARLPTYRYEYNRQVVENARKSFGRGRRQSDKASPAPPSRPTDRLHNQQRLCPSPGHQSGGQYRRSWGNDPGRSCQPSQSPYQALLSSGCKVLLQTFERVPARWSCLYHLA